MTSLFEKCCEKCWHSESKKCPDFISCLTSGPLCHTNDACKSHRDGKIASSMLKKTSVPVIYMGLGTCGLGAGAGKTLGALKEYLKENNIEAIIRNVGCIGLCTLEPLMDIKLPGKARISFGNVMPKDVGPIISGVMEGNVQLPGLVGQHISDSDEKWEGVSLFFDHPFFRKQKRWVLQNCGMNDPVNIEEYIIGGGFKALEKTLKSITRKDLCDSIEKSGLRGRGGGGFPTGTKWKFALNTPSDKKFMICNADEGDPGAFMDRALIEGDPYRLIEGLAIAAYGIGASTAYVYIRAEYPLAIERLKESIAKCEELGILGENVFDSGFSLKIKIKMGAGAFVCGEETALMHSIEGKRGMPRPRPPFPAQSGLFGKPSIVNNVETLANLPSIVLNGHDWFAATGTASSKGTKVFALSGNVNRTGLVEVEMGTKISEIINDIGGGIPDGKSFKAAQIGGPSGGCIPPQHMDIEVDYESLKTVGAMMGSGGLVIMDETACMVDVAKFFMDFIQRESCGKCIPCRQGTARMLEILELITSRPENTDSMRALERFQGIITMERLAAVIQDTSLCGLGQTAPNPVLSTLKYFRDEYEAHIYERRCPSGVCRDLLTFTIIEDKCTGCTLCARKCPTQAIKGAVKSPHYIITEKCIRCGACVESCRFNAIEVK
ncbi:4Fe-4S binding protein [Myxococcota bacterium]|nr:4Fe-4S binding protein [Myxococcota bacterium]MBU1382364.1 4Fe-4S binding protein [Myxococcota bacterium]MBU1498701.1 4Fe-4S binding protein [Myxococcota bacterium]